MRTFYYRRGRSAGAAVAMAFIAIGAGRLWREDGGLVMLVFAIAMTLGAAKSALDAMNRKPALSFDQACIRVRKTWGGVEEVPLDQVHDLTLKAYTVRYMGIIPIRRQVYITVVCEGGTFGSRRFRVSTRAMGMSSEQAATLLAALKQTHVDAVGEAGVAMAGAGSRGWGVEIAPGRSNQGFDADAAVARYLATKQAKDLAHGPLPVLPRPAMPLRPSFGRRVS